MPVTDSLLQQFQDVRGRSLDLVRPLSPEDTVVQTMPDVSPSKWHLAHTSWFFETFVLSQAVHGYVPFHPAYAFLFNSYYNAVGPQYPRAERGLLSRPGLAEILEYRAHVDRAIADLLESGACPPDLERILELGLHHEQQHQELFLTDIKHVLAHNPLRPAYGERSPEATPDPGPLGWWEIPAGPAQVGHAGEGFAFDNEGPRHTVHLHAAAVASRPVTNGEYLEFMEAGGYANPRIWLSDGWALAQAERWKAPLYWIRENGRWMQFTLAGLRPVDPHEPVCHVSHYEADAYAAWRGLRLPTEFEWEFAVGSRRAPGESGPVWEWTGSAYLPYPGYRIPEGAVGEYNGKFMSGQMVLRGGSGATPPGHVRPTYRNFFPPHARWQFTGIRVGRDI